MPHHQTPLDNILDRIKDGNLSDALGVIDRQIAAIFQRRVIWRFEDEEEYARLMCVAEYFVFGNDESLVKRQLGKEEADVLCADERVALLMECYVKRRNFMAAENLVEARKLFSEIVVFFEKNMSMSGSEFLFEIVNGVERELAIRREGKIRAGETQEPADGASGEKGEIGKVLRGEFGKKENTIN